MTFEHKSCTSITGALYQDGIGKMALRTTHVLYIVSRQGICIIEYNSLGDWNSCAFRSVYLGSVPCTNDSGFLWT